MEDFKVRLLDEAQSLWYRITALEDFMAARDEYKELTFKHKFAMRMQLFFMRRYYFWLCNRINWHCTSEDIEEYTNPAPLTKAEEPIATEVVTEKKPKVKRKSKKNTKHE